MNKFLIDTQILIWWLQDNPQLGEEAKKIISNPANQIYVSSVTSWEISIKVSLGKLIAPANIDQEVEQEGFNKLDITLKHGDYAGTLVKIHKDPFDRMLIAQSVLNNLTIITSDTMIHRYSINWIDGRI